MEGVYWQCLKLMRRMFIDCRLVHGDLSEYNLLYFQNELYIIDVSQSVEHDHPQALDFLRKDCMNVNDFFERRGVRIGGTRRTFDFIVKEGGTEEGKMEEECQKVREEVEKADKEEEEEGGREGGHEEAVFMGSYIPRSLHELPNSFEEARRLEAGEREGVYTAAVRQMLVSVKEEKGKEEEEEKPVSGGEEEGGEEEGVEGTDEDEEEGEEEEDEDDEDDEEDDDDEDDDEEWLEKKKGGMGGRGLTEDERAARKAERKAEKKAAKAEKSEKRKTKIPKHIKKAKIKATSGARKKR